MCQVHEAERKLKSFKTFISTFSLHLYTHQLSPIHYNSYYKTYYIMNTPILCMYSLHQNYPVDIFYFMYIIFMLPFKYGNGSKESKRSQILTRHYCCVWQLIELHTCHLTPPTNIHLQIMNY